MSENSIQEAKPLPEPARVRVQTVPSEGRNSYAIRDLEQEILKVIVVGEARDEACSGMQGLTADLELLLDELEADIGGKTEEEALRVRTHQLAISKILVFTHGKSDFRLVVGHLHLGRAYRGFGCWEQAINHLTIASTKLGKLTDIKDTKMYNSYILTELSQCYYAQGSHEYALELITRANEIQSVGVSQKQSYQSKETLELVTLCLMKLGRHKEAEASLDKLIEVMMAQIGEFQALEKKLRNYFNSCCREDALSEDSFRGKETWTNGLSRKSESSELGKCLDLLADRLTFLVVDYDKAGVREEMERLRSPEMLRQSSQVGEVLGLVEAVVARLTETVKQEKMFKFRLFAEVEGVNRVAGLVEFLKDFEGSVGDSHVAQPLSEEETVEAYRLLIHYAKRQGDCETQLAYLRKLEDIFEGREATRQLQIDLLHVKKQLALVLAEQGSEQAGILLSEIRLLENDIFGNGSEAVRKTLKMLKLAQASSEVARSNQSIGNSLRDSRAKVGQRGEKGRQGVKKHRDSSKKLRL